MVADAIASFPDVLRAAQGQALAWAGWIVAGGAGSALVSDVLLSRISHLDSRTGYLARFLDVPADTIVPLPPATALWALYSQRNREADPDGELPPGATTLSGSYLVLLPRGAALVCIHNLETAALAPDPDVPDLVVGVDGRPCVADSVISPESFPLMLEEDAVKRANLVDYLLKAKFRYAGAVHPLVLLKDENGLAGPMEDEVTRSGLDVVRIDFEDPEGARAALSRIEGGSVPEVAAVKTWFQRWGGRTTSPRRRVWRVILLALGVCVGLGGDVRTILDLLPLS